MPTLLAPRYWGAHLLALVLTAAAIGLGLWQLDAWRAHRAAEAVDLTHAEPVPLADVIGPDDPFPGNRVGQPVVLEGTWVPGGTVYVSGREQDGHEGYWVVTPLGITGEGDPAIPVVRGWVADLDDVPAPPTGQAELVGWLQPTEGTGEMDEDPSDDVLPQLRTADVIQHVDQDLYGAYAVATDADAGTGTASSGLAPATLEQLPDAGRFTALRNLLYAIEWWFFAAFAAFVWWRWTQDVRRVADTEEEPQEDPVPSEP